ncbi:ectonucleoside triphosphate diphosphohydrolase 2-like isoform X1 [Mobula hypostoma]|uniref:ectonucleoside triphosphate diphosphohydrolase 2-like isoform X1 n=1 Tax=Mobula hypostoma TaxID=723540 RepID=UPI002FC3BE31
MARLPQLGLSVTLGALGVLGIVLLAATSWDWAEPPKHKYGIVIDAGSSRTTLFIYKWLSGKENNTGVVSEESSCQVEGPGISSYAEEPAKAGKSLKACLDEALRNIPSERHSETPLYLGATAGMRLLKRGWDASRFLPPPICTGPCQSTWIPSSSPLCVCSLTDPEATRNVFAAVNSTLRSYSFSYRGAKILSGSEEGVFGWVTANYLLENFIKYGWVGRWVNPTRGTVGAMDLGGASTQITFVPDVPVREPESKMDLQLYGHNYTVYTHSYLCYGKDQVIRKVRAKILATRGSSTDVVNPCLPMGYNSTFGLKYLYESPCTKDDKPSTYSPATNITFRGSSNPPDCQRQVESIFNFTLCDHGDCAFNNIYQPPVTGSFLAFAAFYHTFNFLETTLGKSVKSPDELKEAAKTVCEMDFKTLKEKATRIPEKWLVDYCTMSYYIYSLITHGYKFNKQTFSNIAFQKKVEGSSIGWALGYMLNLTNMIPADDLVNRKVQLAGAWWVIIVIFILVIVAGVLVFVLFSHSVKNESGVL